MDNGKSDGSPPPNPKKAFGDKKPPFAQLPLAGVAHASLALMDGANKYGFRNWRKDPVEAMTYLHAMQRHAALWQEGEEFARDTGVNNLGAVIACAMILLDAQVHGTLLDNRSPNPAACDLLHELEAQVANLNKMQDDREAEKKKAREGLDPAPEANEVPWRGLRPFVPNT